MKVCVVTTSFIRSADDHYARFVYEQSKSILAAGDDVTVTVIAPHAHGLLVREQIDGLTIRRCRYFRPTKWQRLAYQHEGWFQTLRRSWLARIQLPLMLAAMLRALWQAAGEADILHAQWTPTAALALIVKWGRGIPVVVSVRGADLNAATGSGMGRILTRCMIDRADYVVTVSDEFKDILARDLGCKAPLAAVYNGVDSAQFRPRSRLACRAELGLPEAAPMVLYVGGLIRRKGVDILLRAAADQVAQAADLTLYLVGEGPESRALGRLASELGVARNVRFIGAVPKSRMHLWMGAADMLVLASHSEGRPNVLLEALASSTPIIATAVGGTRELIADGTDGLLFQPGDVAGLSRNMTRLRHDPDLASRLSANGPAKIERLGLTWRAHGRQLLGIYRQILGS